MFKESAHKIGYLAVQAHWPEARVLSKAHIDLAGEYSYLLNVNPKYASNFLVFDKKAPKEDQLVCVWILFASYDKEKPETGFVKISETLMRNIVSDFYLYSNLHLQTGFYAKPKVRIIVITKTKTGERESTLISKPIKMSDIVSWHNNNGDEQSFESVRTADLYRQKIKSTGELPKLDPRPVMPGHFYHLLRSHDYNVLVQATDTELVYHYPFDFINPEDRHNRKTEPEYIYSSAKHLCYSYEDAIKKAKEVPDAAYLSAGVLKLEGKKTLRQVLRMPAEIEKIGKELVHENLKTIGECVTYIKDKYPEVLLFNDYPWYLCTPLSQAAKELY